MKETGFNCPVCGGMIYWNETTSGEVTDPSAAWDDDDANVKESFELKCKACWTRVEIPADRAPKEWSQEEPEDLNHDEEVMKEF